MVFNHSLVNDIDNAHRLPVVLYRLSECCVLVVDEQHRFGTSNGHVQKFELRTDLSKLSEDVRKLSLRRKHSLDFLIAVDSCRFCSVLVLRVYVVVCVDLLLFLLLLLALLWLSFALWDVEHLKVNEVNLTFHNDLLRWNDIVE